MPPSTPFRIVLASVLLAGLAFAAEPPAPPVPGKTPTELVALLGDTSFKVREAAAKDLAAMGANAREALEAGFRGSDAEVKARCEKLLTAFRETDRLARIDRFEKAEIGSDAADLPFWKLFADAVGDSKAGRKNYARLMRVHGAELAGLERDPPLLSDSHADRLFSFSKRQENRKPDSKPSPVDGPEADELSVLLLLGCDPRTTGNPRIANTGYGFMNYEMFVNCIMDPNAGNPTVRKLFVRWTRTQTSLMSVWHALQLMQTFKMAEGYETGLAVMAKHKRGILHAEALYMVGLHSKSHQSVLFLEALKDTSVVWNGTMRIGGEVITTSLQISDVGLAVLMRLDGQDYRDYNYPHFRTSWFGPNPSLTLLGFESDEQRKTALDRWRAAHTRIERLRSTWPW